MTNSLSAYASEQQPMGFFRIFATPPGGALREITLFRGAPVKVTTVTTGDPFTDTTASLEFPQITVFDNPGEGDLTWLVPNCNIDIIFCNVGNYDFDWRWEGYIASYNFSLSGSDSSFTMDLKGALYGLDDYVAVPFYPKRPIPYEILLAMAFDQDQHPCWQMGQFTILFPPDWNLTVPEFKDPTYLSALKPWGVATGQKWTGYTNRSTGAWDALLTTYVQGLLSNMYWKGGSQWSIRNLGQRRPQLYLRTIPDPGDDSIVEIDVGAPGVEVSGTRDFTQRAGVLYGVGQDFAGIAFSNIQVSPDGRTTYYKPFAWDQRMWPRGSSNPNFDPYVKPKEAQIKFQDGIDEVAAIHVAEGQFQRFSDPGITGSVTLTTDPRLSSGELMPRLLIKGGVTLRINGILGLKEGVLAHVTQAQADFDQMTTTLTFDTKYRDQLTVDEVQARTRDALQPLHALQVGKYSNTIQDLVIPWSYQAGSGIVPTPAKTFFNEKLPQNATFPYEQWTKQYPPSNPSYANWYIKIGPTNTSNSSKNWSSQNRVIGDVTLATAAIPIRMSQAGTIRLSQMAAYDKNGNVMPVKFHLSVYTSNGTAVNSMPQFPVGRYETNADGSIKTDGSGNPIPNPDFPKYLDARKTLAKSTGTDPKGDIIPTTYTRDPLKQGGNQVHPFYKGAWETVQPNGLNWPWPTDVNAPEQMAGMCVGWGNYYEPAGFYPGRWSKGADRTGLLSDDATWTWSFSDPNEINLDNQKLGQPEDAGMLFVMIYCDDQFDEPVYFMGRFVRMEPGQST